LAWFDLIPVFSFISLRGQCRTCHEPISWLYPTIEILTTLIFTALYLSSPYFGGYFLFCSALIVVIRSDLEAMLISPWSTLALIPLGITLSFMDLIPIMPLDSIMGACVGFFSLWSIGFIFKMITKKMA
jgi:Type IV leader peptidase family./Bacterial Peptidase A24 N-terminal domain.